MADTSEDLRRLARELIDHAPARFEFDELHEAARLTREDPAALTDSMIRHVACYEPHTVLPLLRKRADAVQRCAAQAIAQVQAQVAEQRQAAAATPPSIDPASLDGLTFEALCAKYPDVPVTLDTLKHVVSFMDAMNARNAERNQRLDALERRNAELVKQLGDLRVELDAAIHVRS